MPSTLHTKSPAFLPVHSGFTPPLPPSAASMSSVRGASDMTSGPDSAVESGFASGPASERGRDPLSGEPALSKGHVAVTSQSLGSTTEHACKARAKANQKIVGRRIENLRDATDAHSRLQGRDLVRGPFGASSSASAVDETRLPAKRTTAWRG